MTSRRLCACISLAFAAIVSTWGASSLLAEVTLPATFSDHMVLQRDVAIPVWGWAEKGEKITVQFRGQTQSVTAGTEGKWSLKLKKVDAGGPFELTVTGTNVLKIKDVLVGEVWLASGQSNMAMKVASVKNSKAEIDAATFPKIRMFTTARQSSPTSRERCQGDWQVCNPQTVGSFSATAFFFGRRLHQELDVPIGLINSSWGGTAVEAWTSLPAQEKLTAAKPILSQWNQMAANHRTAVANYKTVLENWKRKAAAAKNAGKRAPKKPRAPVNPLTNQNRPSNLFNGMIQPHIPYAIRGAIWYQGERNRRGFPQIYGQQLTTLITDWRTRWGQGDFPFIWAQLPNFTAKQTQPSQTDGWVLVQEGMLKTLALPNTGMGINIDIGEARDIHPKNKQDVGKRLALWALGTTYDKTLTYSGPIFRAAKADPRNANIMVLQFDHVGRGLQFKGDELIGFAIAGADKKFVFAKAKVVGDTVHVWHQDIKQPKSVRYGWAPNPNCNLYNKSGLPASPFRTDDWQE